MDELAHASDSRQPVHREQPLCAGRTGLPLGVPVLVAEHDAECRRIISLALAERGYLLHQVSDGASALQFVRRARPPLVLLAEEELPELGGFQLARLIALKQAAESLYSIIVLTADLRSALRQFMYRNKHDAVTLEVLVKPLQVAELLMAVDMAAEQLVGKRTTAGWPASDQTIGGGTPDG